SNRRPDFGRLPARRDPPRAPPGGAAGWSRRNMIRDGRPAAGEILLGLLALAAAAAAMQPAGHYDLGWHLPPRPVIVYEEGHSGGGSVLLHPRRNSLARSRMAFPGPAVRSPSMGRLAGPALSGGRPRRRHRPRDGGRSQAAAGRRRSHRPPPCAGPGRLPI